MTEKKYDWNMTENYAEILIVINIVYCNLGDISLCFIQFQVKISLLFSL